MDFFNVSFIFAGVVFIVCVVGACINVLTRPDHKEKEKNEAHVERFKDWAAGAFAAAACLLVLLLMYRAS